MKRQAFEILKDDGLAEDAVHDAFIKLTRHLDGVEEVESHKTQSFLIIIVKCVSLDMRDKLKRRPVKSIEDTETILATADAVFERIEVEELLLKIKSLPDIHRDILELKLYYDLRDKQLADILGISPAAARKRLERARNALLKIITEGDEI